MQTALVLGGTRFFGKHLVERLLEQGVDVTVATRGQTEDGFGDRVKRITVDRFQTESMRAAFADAPHYDVIYDNICYNPHQARAAAEVFAGKVGRYIFTSTMSVYEYNEEAWREEGFDPYRYKITLEQAEFDYREGKRQAEAVFFQQAEFPVVAVRFPIVLGTDDYTRRLHFHVEHIAREQEFGLPNREARMVFITAEEAGEFLAFLGTSDFAGPINACSTGDISLRDLFALIEAETGKQAIIVPETAERDHMSPYGIERNWYMVADKAVEIGFTFRSLQEYLPGLIRELHRTT